MAAPRPRPATPPGLLDDEDPGRWERVKQALWETNLNAPVRAVYNLMNADPYTLYTDTGAAGQQAVADSFDAAGGVMVGGSVVPKPSNAIRMGFDGPKKTPDLRTVLDAKAKQMELKPDKRIQPDPNRTRVLDKNYKERSPGGFSKNLAESYPRNPDPTAKLPLNDRARFLIDKREQIAGRLAEKIKAAGQMGTDTQYFYHSDGPIYRSARQAGLSHDEASQFLSDFADHYAATSPRTNTEQNLLNTSLVMAKKSAGIPHREIVGPGSGGISEKGYPMMTGKGGIHGQLIDAIDAGGINSNTNSKPFNFGNNMAGNLSGVTADTHAIRGALMAANEIYPGQVPIEWILPEARAAYAADPSTLVPSMIDDTLQTQKIGPKEARIDAQTEYPVIADVYHSTANQLGVAPAEAQSLGWFSLGDETNLGSEHKTVADIMDERINVTSQALGISPQEVAQLYFRRKIPLMALPAGLLGASMYDQMSADEAQAGAD